MTDENSNPLPGRVTDARCWDVRGIGNGPTPALSVHRSTRATCRFGEGTDQGWLNSILSQPPSANRLNIQTLLQ